MYLNGKKAHTKSPTSKDMRKIVARCEKSGVPFKTVPGMGELINGRVTVKAIRDVSYRDLLGREPEALKIFVEEFGTRPSDRQIHHHLAVVYYRQQQHALARKHYQRAVALGQEPDPEFLKRLK